MWILPINPTSPKCIVKHAHNIAGSGPSSWFAMGLFSCFCLTPCFLIIFPDDYSCLPSPSLCGAHIHLAGSSYVFLPDSIILLLQSIQNSSPPGTHLSWNLISWNFISPSPIQNVEKYFNLIILILNFKRENSMNILKRISSLLTSERFFKVLLITLQTSYIILLTHLGTLGSREKKVIEVKELYAISNPISS